MQEPFTLCSRCRRLNLECKIESNFKRIGKRSKNAEMEREIVQLRRQLANQQQRSPTNNHTPSISVTSVKGESPTMYQSPSAHDQYRGSQEAVASLLDLRSGHDGAAYLRNTNGQAAMLWRIEDVSLTQDRVRELFNQYENTAEVLSISCSELTDHLTTASSPSTTTFCHYLTRLSHQTSTSA